MNVLVISPHLDDETLGAGGTLLRHKQKGDKLFWFLFSATKIVPGARYKAHSVEEVERIASLYDAEYFLLDIAGTTFDRIPHYYLMDPLKDFMASCKPDVVYTVGAGDIHTDHDAVYRAVMNATRPSYFQIPKVLAYEVVSSTTWSFSDKSSWFKPTVYIDIEEQLEEKLKIVETFTSEVHPFPHARSLECIEALAKFRGASVGLRAAEAFHLLREIVID